MFEKLKKIWESPYAAPLAKPLEVAGKLIKESAKRFFREPKSPAFFKRLGMAAGCLALIGVAIGLSPFGPLITTILVGGLAQIPLSIFKDSAVTALKEQFLRIKASPASLLKPSPKALLVVAGITAIGTALALYPPLGVVALARGVGFAVAKRLAVPLLLKMPVNLFKKKTLRAFKRHAAAEESIPQPPVIGEEEMIRSFAGMSGPERQKTFEKLQEKFSADFSAAKKSGDNKPTPPTSAKGHTQLQIPMPVQAPG